MGKSLSKSNKLKPPNSKSIISEKHKINTNNIENDIKTESKPPKFPIHKPKNDKLERDIKRASKKRKRSAIKGRLDSMNPLSPPTVPNKVKSDIKAMSEQDYDEMAILKIKNLIARDCVLFLLNQLLLSVQFYTNFERESYDCIDRNRKMENEKSKRLEKHFKTVVLSDRVHDSIDRKVKFLARHGPLKNQLLSLDTQTMYIVFDNIDVSQPDDTTVYSQIKDTPVYKFVMEDRLFQMREIVTRVSHAGYVKLRSIDIITNNKKSIFDVSDPCTSSSSSFQSGPNLSMDGDQFDYDCEESIIIQSQSHFKNTGMSTAYVNGLPFSMISNGSSSRESSEYDYAYITAFNAHKPLSVVVTHSSEPLSATLIPSDCITLVTRCDEIESDGYVTDEEEKDKLSINEDEDVDSTIKAHSVIGGEEQQYLNSKAFFNYFVNIFRNSLAVELGFEDKDLKNATWKGAAVFVPPYEIIPAIQCPWPNEAFEWGVRERTLSENPFTKQKFQWPTSKMISKVIGFGCHIIPLGFAPKKGLNPNRQLEWKIVFPQAERYLESCMSSAQVKVYMIMKTLLKTFVEPKMENGTNMFTKEHLRSHIFFMCEQNYAAWNEEYLGEAFIRCLSVLIDCITKKYLPDYFLPKRNLFENIPERVLRNLCTQLYRIYENPVMHLMIALKNLKYHKTFYPKFAYKKLYNFLVIDDALHLLNPTIFSNIMKAEDSIKQEESRRESAAIGPIADFENHDRRLKKKKRLVKMIEPINEEKSLSQRRLSIESINTQFTVPNSIDGSRQRLIFHLFARHFLDMGKRALSNGALNTTQIYLKQTERLAKILIEFGEDEDAINCLNDLEPIMRHTIRLLRVNSTTGPSLPRRQSFDPPNHKLSATTRSKEVYVNLSEMNKIDLIQRKNSATSDSTLKNFKKQKPRPAVIPLKPKELKVQAFIHHRLQLEDSEIDNDYNILKSSQMNENKANSISDIASLQPNDKFRPNGLENLRIRA